LYRALARGSAGENERETAPCLIGQPVALGSSEASTAALRISAGARLVSEAWSPDENIARDNLERAIGQVDVAVAKLEGLLTGSDGLEFAGASHGA
jgi:hypothetical protein